MIRPTLTVATTLLAVAASAAATVRLAGLDADARRLLDFSFAGADASALQLALHNARLAAAVLLAAIATPTIGRATVAVDGVVGLVLAGNAVAIGIALGAYGDRAATALALHAPLELAALSLAAGALINAHRGRLPIAELTRTGVACAALLIAGGALETTQIGGLR